MHLPCPINGESMESVTLDDGLQAYRCESTGGHYIPASCYMDWLGKQPARLHLLSESGITGDSETPRALLCPEPLEKINAIRIDLKDHADRNLAPANLTDR